MQIVIDIDDKSYERILKHYNTFSRDRSSYEKQLIDGTPLPEHHGDLIDRKELFERLKDNCAGRCEFCSNWSVEGCKNILDCTALVKSTEGGE